MSRQIRLEDDVAALVEDYQQAEGLRSLSAAANRMLRLAAGPEQDAELPIPANATVTIGVPSRRIDPHGTNTVLLANGCQHPALARRGPLCGLCGATIG